MKKQYLFLLFPLLFCLAGCVRVSSNTLSNKRKIPQGFPFGSSFCIVPAQKNRQLINQEVADKISTFLDKQDMNYTITDRNRAHYLLVFDFSMSRSKNRVNSLAYIPGTTQKKSGNAHGSNNWGSSNKLDYKEETINSGSFVPTTQDEITFTRCLTITIYDAGTYRKNKKEEIWFASAVSSGSSDDIRQIMNRLLESVFKNFGKDTKKNVNNSYWSWWNS